MARTLDDVTAALPPERRRKVEARTHELVEEVRGLNEVRRLAGMSQAQIAEQLGAKQPTVAKIEKQADFYVSTLERFVRAAGGEVEIRVTLPGRAPVRFRRFADLAGSQDA